MTVKTFQYITESVLNFYEYIFNNWITGKNGKKINSIFKIKDGSDLFWSKLSAKVPH